METRRRTGAGFRKVLALSRRCSRKQKPPSHPRGWKMFVASQTLLTWTISASSCVRACAREQVRASARNWLCTVTQIAAQKRTKRFSDFTPVTSLNQYHFATLGFFLFLFFFFLYETLHLVERFKWICSKWEHESGWKEQISWLFCHAGLLLGRKSLIFSSFPLFKGSSRKVFPVTY